jgi:hypothetical protein
LNYDVAKQIADTYNNQMISNILDKINQTANNGQYEISCQLIPASLVIIISKLGFKLTRLLYINKNTYRIQWN